MMQRSKESDLTISALLFAMRCIAEGDLGALARMHFGADEVEALKQLSIADLYRADSLSAHCLNITLDRDVYWPLVNHIKRNRAMESTIEALIVADAPKEIFGKYFGMGSREYAARRKAIGLSSGVGRPPNLTETESQALWDSIQALGLSSEVDTLRAEELLQLHQVTGFPIRSIWRILCTWEEFGANSNNVQPRKLDRRFRDQSVSNTGNAGIKRCAT